MAKSKNHTNANQAYKNHRNGIKRAPKLCLHMKQRGGWQPAIVNSRRVRKHNQKQAIVARNEKLAAVRAKFAKK